jgi:hypothetical protein
MTAPSRNSFFGLALALVTACYAIAAAAQATSGGIHSTTQITPSAKNLDPADWEPILLESATANDVPSPQPVDSRNVRLELAQLREALQSITPHQRALVNKWAVTNEGRVWRLLLDELTLHNLAAVPSSLRLYAALHIAIADAEVAARNRQRAYRRPHPAELDPGIHSLAKSLSPYAYPSDLAAETGAAERILLFVRPEAAGQINALADESMRALENSGLYLKSDCEAGRQLGHLVAEEVLSVLARDRRPNQLVFAKEKPWEQPAAPETVRLGARYQVAHSEYDDSLKWTAPILRQGVTYGDLPPWNQAVPADPTAGSWQPLILESTDLFHAPPPPANSSAQTMHDMEEIVAALNNRTCYTDFISFKWANEQPGRWPAEIMDGLMSRYDWDAPTTARAEAILYAAMYDSLLTTWHEKFRYLRPRPALLEPDLPTVILTPKHPSYPAGHGTYVGAAVTVLQEIFPDERSEYEYLVPEVNNARVWAGVHFRDDMLAGNIIGEQVADAVMEKVHLDGSPGERSKRVLGQPLVTSAFFGDGGPKYH